MNTLDIRKIATAPESAEQVSALLDKENIGFHSISCVDWPDVAPYCPDVKFRIAHTGSDILLQYVVKEEYTRAEAGADNGPVWEDSCVEFFISFTPENYYNLECNCAATILCGAGKCKAERARATQEVLDGVKRFTTIPEKKFDTREAPAEWSVCLVIPASTFYKDNITDFSGIRARGNFYKCGDLLPKPHFISWAPITVDSPNFHLPEFFGELNFEK